MTDTMTSNETKQKVLSFENIKSYTIVLIILFIIIALYHLLSGPSLPPDGGLPPSNLPPGSSQQTPAQMFDTWPIWGQLIIPQLPQLVVAVVVFLVFLSIAYFYYQEDDRAPNLLLIVVLGIALAIGTNLIQGWEMGIEMPISGSTEIFQDAIQIENWLMFIGEYESIQPTLTVHAQTQLPGVILVIYLLYLILQFPSLISIGLCVIAASSSVFFLNKILLKLFDAQSSRYTTVLFLLLPAIQIYYLANVYAIVASLVLGVIYLYLHENKRLSIAGSILCLFLGTFISFLFVYVILFLFVFEALNSYISGERTNIFGRIENLIRSLDKLIIISIGVGVIYGLLYLTLGFNYISTFLYASALENPDGFMLFSNPLQYLTTRIQNILDIMIFFGPILLVFCYRGLQNLREKATQDKDAAWKYLFVLSALIALLLLFLTGAPKKGETARICMFVLPFLLIPVMEYLNAAGYPHRERIILLVLVFGQAVLMQLIGVYVW